MGSNIRLGAIAGSLVVVVLVLVGAAAVFPLGDWSPFHTIGQTVRRAEDPSAQPIESPVVGIAFGNRTFRLHVAPEFVAVEPGGEGQFSISIRNTRGFDATGGIVARSSSPLVSVAVTPGRIRASSHAVAVVRARSDAPDISCDVDVFIVSHGVLSSGVVQVNVRTHRSVPAGP